MDIAAFVERNMGKKVRIVKWETHQHHVGRVGVIQGKGYDKSVEVAFDPPLDRYITILDVRVFALHEIELVDDGPLPLPG